MTDKILVIYDGDCRFCRYGIDIVRRLDTRGMLDFCPFGHPAAEEVISVIPAQTRHESMHALFEGAVHSGTEAARIVVRVLPFGTLAVAAGLYRLYPLLARYRWLLGRISPDRVALVTCGRSEERRLVATI